jgi:hypothetical protein
MDAAMAVEADWHEDLQQWLEPFLAGFKRSVQRCWASLHLQGLLGPGARKSVRADGRTRVSWADAAVAQLRLHVALDH